MEESFFLDLGLELSLTIHPSQDTLFHRPIKAKNPPENAPKFGYIKKHPAWVRVLFCLSRKSVYRSFVGRT